MMTLLRQLEDRQEAILDAIVRALAQARGLDVDDAGVHADLTNEAKDLISRQGLLDEEAMSTQLSGSTLADLIYEHEQVSQMILRAVVPESTWDTDDNFDEEPGSFSPRFLGTDSEIPDC
jgi:hypothetical protein